MVAILNRKWLHAIMNLIFDFPPVFGGLEKEGESEGAVIPSTSVEGYTDPLGSNLRE